MTSREAREILKTYRPGIDWADPAFHEAMAQAERDPDLKNWIREQSRLYEVIRNSLKSVPVPEDLAQKILARHRRRRPLVWQLAAALIALLAVAGFWLKDRPRSAIFADYRASMVELVSKQYPMGLETPDLDRVRKFLANNQSPADYVLPASLKRTPLLGCSTLSWGESPVSMLCFHRPDGKGLWLFITSHVSLAGAPLSTAPIFTQTNGFDTATWRIGDRVYLLASRGGPDGLRSYFEE